MCLLGTLSKTRMGYSVVNSSCHLSPTVFTRALSTTRTRWHLKLKLISTYSVRIEAHSVVVTYSFIHLYRLFNDIGANHLLWYSPGLIRSWRHAFLKIVPSSSQRLLFWIKIRNSIGMSRLWNVIVNHSARTCSPMKERVHGHMISLY